MTHSRMESQQGMFKLRQRVKKCFFLFPSIREVMAIFFIRRQPTTEPRERESKSRTSFSSTDLENHQIDVSKLT